MLCLLPSFPQVTGGDPGQIGRFSFFARIGNVVAPILMGLGLLALYIEFKTPGFGVFGIAGKGRIALGYDADFTVVDLHARKTITHEWSASRCGWTPFDGMEAKSWPIATFVRGTLVMMEGALLAPGRGEPVRFVETLPHA